MSTKRVVLITGSRDWWLPVPIFTVLQDAYGVIHGGARGADAIAHRYAERNDMLEFIFRADRTRWPQAGPERNEEMVRFAYALSQSNDYEIVCHAFPFEQSKSTPDCIRRAERWGLTVVIHEHGELVGP